MEKNERTKQKLLPVAVNHRDSIRMDMQYNKHPKIHTVKQAKNQKINEEERGRFLALVKKSDIDRISSEMPFCADYEELQSSRISRDNSRNSFKSENEDNHASWYRSLGRFVGEATGVGSPPGITAHKGQELPNASSSREDKGSNTAGEAKKAEELSQNDCHLKNSTRIFSDEENKLIANMPLLQDLAIAVRVEAETARRLRNDLDCQVRLRTDLEKKLADANTTTGKLTQQLEKAQADVDDANKLSVTLRRALDTITKGLGERNDCTEQTPIIKRTRSNIMREDEEKSMPSMKIARGDSFTHQSPLAAIAQSQPNEPGARDTDSASNEWKGRGPKDLRCNHCGVEGHKSFNCFKRMEESLRNANKWPAT